MPWLIPRGFFFCLSVQYDESHHPNCPVGEYELVCGECVRDQIVEQN